MEWNLKAPAWDLAGFAISNLDVAQGSTSSEIGGNCSFTEKEPRVARMAQLDSGSSKKVRARAARNGAQIVPCLVDGCISNLSRGREYHRRHKVCEQHSKTPQVMIRGHKQRFCQQCNRFHLLEEFDEVKRSCRKRLHRHNTRRRRRKPPPDPISCAGSFFSNFQGSQLLSFSNTQVYPSTAWTGAVSSDENAYRHQQLNTQSSFPRSSSSQPLVMSHLLQPDSIPLAAMDSVLVSGEIHYPGSFHLGSDESSGNNVSQTLPFHWQ